MRPVLILRPEPGAAATARRAIALGLVPVVVPLFVVVPRVWTAPAAAEFDAIMLTSANAVRHGGPTLRRYAMLPGFAVGDATRAAAIAAGLPKVTTAGRDVAAVIAAITAAGHARVIHPVGRDTTALPPHTLTITRAVVYASDAVPAPVLPASTVALVHSARAATRLAAIAPVRGDHAIVAISAGVATAAGTGWASVAVAASPDDRAMLALAQRLCQSGGDD